MSKRKELIEREIAKFTKEYARKKGQIDPNDCHFDRKMLRRIQKMNPAELKEHISGDMSEQRLKDASAKTNLDVQLLWLKQRKQIQFFQVQIISVDVSGIEDLDEQGKSSPIDF